jgi:hypothetical protein
MPICKVCSSELTSANLYRSQYKVCKTCHKARSAKYLKESRQVRFSRSWYRVRYDKIRQRARSTNRACTLTIDEFIKLKKSKKCFYCGSFLTLTTIDRMDNNEGYFLSNCVPCCYRCNRLKSDDYTAGEMLIIGKALAKIDKARATKRAVI